MTPPPFSEKIAILAGGPSCEREISLISGRSVQEALLSLGQPVLLVDAVGDFMPKLKQENISFAFIALHGTFGEDGTVQRLLEKEGIAYTGSGPLASEKAFDKELSQCLFKKEGIRVPLFAVLRSVEEGSNGAPFDFPLVVKPAKSGSSVGVSILKEADGYKKACEEAFRYSDTVIVESYIPGRELTVGILGDKALPVVEVIAGREFYDYQAKYEDCGTRYEFPARLAETEREAVVAEAMKAYQAIGSEVMSRVDIILSRDGKPHVLEVNTIPGLTPKSLLPKAAFAAGIHFPELCARIISLSMAKTRGLVT
jgi:D-alanine-D-alanine ligase